MRVLVLGGLGYVGTVLAEEMLRRSDLPFEVVDAGWFPTEFSNKLTAAGVRTHFVDIRDIDVDLFSGFQVVVNLAAVSNDSMGTRFDKATSSINHLGALGSARLAKAAGVGLYIFASSASVYGDSAQFSCTESSPTSPLTEYSRSKLHAEESILELSDSSFRPVCLRFATACGVSPNQRTDLVLNDFVSRAVQNDEVVLRSTGDALRPLVNVRDMARAIMQVIDRGDLLYGQSMFNVGFDEWNFKIRDLASEVAVQLGVPLRTIEGAVTDKRSYELDFSRWYKFSGGLQPVMSISEVIGALATKYYRSSSQNLQEPTTNEIRLRKLESLVEAQVLSEDLLTSLSDSA